MEFKNWFFTRIVINLALLFCGECADQISEAHFLNQFTGSGSNFYERAQTLPPQAPFGGTNFLGSQQGYSYQTPASTYKTFSPLPLETHTSQTAPLALSIHADDYAKFDNEPQTFFVPKSRVTTTLKNKPNPQFYVPRLNVPQVGSGENKKSRNEQLHSISNKQKPQNLPPTPEDPLAYSSNDLSRLSEESPDHTTRQQLVQSFSKESLIEREPKSYRPPSTKNLQNCDYGVQGEEPNGLTVAQSATGSSAQKIPNETSSSFTERPVPQNQHFSEFNNQQRRLQILRVLLAEYLALTLHSNNNYQREGSEQNPPFPHVSPLSQSFSEDTSRSEHLKSTQAHTTNAARRPHFTYGSPYEFSGSNVS